MPYTVSYMRMHTIVLATAKSCRNMLQRSLLIFNEQRHLIAIATPVAKSDMTKWRVHI